MGKKIGKSRNYGHLKGVETVKKIVRSSIKLRIPTVTFYVFIRKLEKAKKEIDYLLKLIKIYFLKKYKILKNKASS